MATIRLKYLVEDIDRHGNVRRYVRVPGRTKVRIREQPGTAEFMAAYERALRGSQTIDNGENGTQPGAKGSLKWLCERYYGTADYRRLDDRTKWVRRNVLDNLCRRHGDKPA